MPTLDLRELGLTGLERFGGWVYEEFLQELQGQRAVQVYQEMSSNDPVIGAVLHAIEMLIRQVEWRVEPGGRSLEDMAAAHFLETCLEDMEMTWEETIAEILSMLVYGWSYHEILYKVRHGQSRDPAYNSRYSDGRIGWRSFPIGTDSLWEWQLTRTVGYLGWCRWHHLTTSRVIPMEKSLLFHAKLKTT